MHKRKQPITPVEPLLLTIPQVSAMLVWVTQKSMTSSVKRDCRPSSLARRPGSLLRN